MTSQQGTQYQLKNNGEFIISNYNSTKLFSSFFPGVAGKNGIPMWTFYVNRGQCICSMGIEGKHHPIMEFLPANWAYNLVTTQGFRTFLKFPADSAVKFYEPFQNNLRDEEIDRSQNMTISASKLKLEEVNHTLGLKFTVEYFNIPQENYAGLIRRVQITNLGDNPVQFEMLDGLPLIIPYGIDNNGLKFMRRLFEAFVEVVNFENKAPFFKGKVKPADRPDVVKIKKGNFYLGFAEDGKLVTPIVDPVKIFGIRGDYNYPQNFLRSDSEEIIKGQILENRLPCAMGLVKSNIATGETYTYNSVIAHATSVQELNDLIPKITQLDYIDKKAKQDSEIIKTLTQNNFICSSSHHLDQYARQNFLDNALRGGFPHTLKGKNHSIALHLYSRKHGDLERDYNDYRLNPTPYSQGNGNYRDVNQNRRCDLYFNPDVQEGNVEHFYNLIQLDGFNPLVIKEKRFSIIDSEKLRKVLSEYLDKKDVESVISNMQKPFTPGELMTFLRNSKIKIAGENDSFIADFLSICELSHDTRYGEGFWTDHWTYNLDLLENFLAVFPDKKKQLLFEKKDSTFYDNPHRVQPRDDKYVVWEGKAMQLNSVIFDEEKDDLINLRKSDKNKVRTEYGTGQIYKTTLFNKMLSLLVNKLASLDANGVGVEMETDKPNWYDALNGLPGLIGSSLSETLEVKRHILFMLEALEEIYPEVIDFVIFEELIAFMNGLNKILKADSTSFEFWDKATSKKEKYRTKTRLGISGKEVKISKDDIVSFLKAGLKKLNIGISKAWNEKDGVINTYFVNEPTEYNIIKITDSAGHETDKLNEKGLPCFRAKKFRQKPLPLFLEGPVHYLRCHKDQEKAAELANNIRQSGLYDQQLKMYKVNESLADQPHEIGRARTFSPGWFENESIWLHMEYKYMLELLRNRLYDQFYSDFKNVFIPFLKPEVYGRSILENSSFIVSSANPDPSIHGNGFVARLSGATAEFINILSFMTIGQKPFEVDENNELYFSLDPALPGWLFTKKSESRKLMLDGTWQDVEFSEDTFSFIFLGEILVTYHNSKRKDTFGENAAVVSSWKLIDKVGNNTIIKDNKLSGKLAEKIRNREIKRIYVDLN
ncbi:MAG: hypothetical protein K9N09_11945 [Candidatus Cloacimonetes bacterium]|nr:hypothetical protein [Candidatus Cloacimonadota bacterium]MCF7869396.1 hypothetical protein [Candidatus Cloacimonadota bacterium]